MLVPPCAVTPEPHEDAPAQVTLQAPLVQVTPPLHELTPQATAQLEPPHATAVQAVAQLASVVMIASATASPTASRRASAPASRAASKAHPPSGTPPASGRRPLSGLVAPPLEEAPPDEPDESLTEPSTPPAPPSPAASRPHAAARPIMATAAALQRSAGETKETPIVTRIRPAARGAPGNRRTRHA